jgi:type 1 fimbria pilin
MRKIITMAALAVLVLLSAAARAGTLTPGEYGGDGASASVDADGTAHFVFPCATGVTGGPVTLDSAGRFSIAGTLTTQLGSGGTVTSEVVYAGNQHGPRITFSVSNTSCSLGTWTVILGEQATINACH